MMASRLRETDALLTRLATEGETHKTFEQVASETHRFFVG
jgi:hypothetical protein